MFADDKNLFISNRNIGKLFQKMNKELQVYLIVLKLLSSLSDWFKAT